MKQEDLDKTRLWFDSHVASYLDMDPEGLKNIRLKEEHTFRVLEATRAIAQGENLTDEETLIASAVALLHDAGRFPQYRRWRTFRDSESDNHARLGIEVIREQNLLDHLSLADRLLIEEAVRFHNMMAIPERRESPTDLYIKLIRDADKLDIWFVFLNYFRQPEEERASAAGLGFPDLPVVTPECVASFMDGSVVKLDSCKVINDFRVLQMSWVYDLNFPTTFRLLRERNYLNHLAAGLPEDSGLSKATDNALEHISKMADRPY